MPEELKLLLQFLLLALLQIEKIDKRTAEAGLLRGGDLVGALEEQAAGVP